MRTVQTNFKLFISLFTLLFFFSCKKNNDIGGKTYTDANGTSVTLNNADWYLTKQGNGGTVNLKFTGQTNADKITLTTYGDGVDTDINIAMTGGQFTEDSGISFTAESLPSGNFQQSTTLKAYKGSDVLVVTLTSGQLHY